MTASCKAIPSTTYWTRYHLHRSIYVHSASDFCASFMSRRIDISWTYLKFRQWCHLLHAIVHWSVLLKFRIPAHHVWDGFQESLSKNLLECIFAIQSVVWKSNIPESFGAFRWRKFLWLFEAYHVCIHLENDFISDIRLQQMVGRFTVEIHCTFFLNLVWPIRNSMRVLSAVLTDCFKNKWYAQSADPLHTTIVPYPSSMAERKLIIERMSNKWSICDPITASRRFSSFTDASGDFLTGTKRLISETMRPEFQQFLEAIIHGANSRHLLFWTLAASPMTISRVLAAFYGFSYTAIVDMLHVPPTIFILTIPVWAGVLIVSGRSPRSWMSFNVSSFPIAQRKFDKLLDNFHREFCQPQCLNSSAGNHSCCFYLYIIGQILLSQTMYCTSVRRQYQFCLVEMSQKPPRISWMSPSSMTASHWLHWCWRTSHYERPMYHWWCGYVSSSAFLAQRHCTTLIELHFTWFGEACLIRRPATLWSRTTISWPSNTSLRISFLWK